MVGATRIKRGMHAVVEINPESLIHLSMRGSRNCWAINGNNREPIDSVRNKLMTPAINTVVIACPESVNAAKSSTNEVLMPHRALSIVVGRANMNHANNKKTLPITAGSILARIGHSNVMAKPTMAKQIIENTCGPRAVAVHPK
jgi:hypothetical protein